MVELEAHPRIYSKLPNESRLRLYTSRTGRGATIDAITREPGILLGEGLTLLAHVRGA